MYCQTTINIIVTASSYVLVGVSFYITFSVARFYHFTHGAFFTLGAYIAYSLANLAGLPLFPAIIFTAGTLGLTAMITDKLIYRRIRQFSRGHLIPLLASLGIYTVVQNIISICYNDSAIILPGAQDWGVVDVASGRITIAQIVQVVLAIAAVASSWLILKRTSIGQMMRAVGQDRELSLALGIPVERMINFSFGMGYGMAAIAGVAAAANVDLTPTMGMRPMMMGMVAMIIGGSTLGGTVVGAVLLAAAQHIGVIWLPTQWQESIAFFILLVFLIIKPLCFFGEKPKKITI